MRKNTQFSSKLVLYCAGGLGWGRMGVLPRPAVRATSGPSIWLALAFGLNAIIAVIAILIGRGLNLAELLAAGPLLACARCGGRMTALVAGYAIALCAIDRKSPPLN